MADGNATTTKARSEFIDAGSIGMRGDFYLELAIPRFCCGAEELADYSLQLAKWGRAALAMARYRGSPEEDHPDMLDQGLAAAEFLLRLSEGLGEAAQKEASRAQEVDHG